MKKNGFVPIIILVIAILGIVGYFVYKNYLTPPSNPIQTSYPTASATAVSSNSDLISFVKSKLSLSEKATIEVDIDEGNYVYGTAGEPDSSGFYWAAAKTNNQWNYIMSGNGIPNCEDIEIFPIETFNGKFDSCYKGSELIKRK